MAEDEAVTKRAHENMAYKAYLRAYGKARSGQPFGDKDFGPPSGVVLDDAATALGLADGLDKKPPATRSELLARTEGLMK